MANILDSQNLVLSKMLALSQHIVNKVAVKIKCFTVYLQLKLDTLLNSHGDNSTKLTALIEFAIQEDQGTRYIILTVSVAPR